MYVFMYKCVLINVFMHVCVCMFVSTYVRTYVYMLDPIFYVNRPTIISMLFISNDTSDSVLRHRAVVRGKDISAPTRIC